MLRSVVKGIAEAKRRQREIEERQGKRLPEPSDRGFADRDEAPEVEEPAEEEPVDREPVEREPVEEAPPMIPMDREADDEDAAEPARPEPARRVPPPVEAPRAVPRPAEPAPQLSGASVSETQDLPVLLGSESAGDEAMDSFLNSLASFPVHSNLDDAIHADDAGASAFRIPASEEDWRTAMILVEVLSPPVSMRRRAAGAFS
jgi:hypothetical protein